MNSKTKKYFLLIFIVGIVTWFFYFDSSKLFNDSISTVILDSEEELFAAKIATDEQWRFPISDSVTYKFEQCILTFEDRYFRYHPGVRLESLLRATYQNVKAGKVISGASTITMQVIRLSRKGKSRSIGEKFIEILAALRLEFTKSKNEILNLYASYAPFGGNVVGLDAAAWRYFGRPSHSLSWAENAMLAVLPNAPGLIHLGKNRERLKRKRNGLLFQLYQNGTLDELTYQLSLKEEIPDKPFPLPQKSIHLMQSVENKSKGVLRSTLNSKIQDNLIQVTQEYIKNLSGNMINNLACMVIEIETGNVVGYVGNAMSSKEGGYNNMIYAQRSTGSLLKPFLYGLAMDGGLITQESILADVPTYFGAYSPKNYLQQYEGSVRAGNALARSLNVPSVRLLSDFGVEKFRYDLNKLGLKSINKPASHYGLTLILGGAESNLFELTESYAKMAYKLKYQEADKVYSSARLWKNAKMENEKLKEFPLSHGAIWNILQSLLEVKRTENDINWRFYENSNKVAWKTGTSYGNKDAWAIGINYNYVVGVWVGNADGEGRPGLTGFQSASPLLFSIFSNLSSNKWFSKPVFSLKEVNVCKHSGFIMSENCEKDTAIFVPEQANDIPVCKYCHSILTTKDGKYRVYKNCFNGETLQKKVFQLTPLMDWYYRKFNTDYTGIPTTLEGCQTNEIKFPLKIIYPQNNTKIYLPKGFDGKRNSVLFEASHRHSEAIINWHLDDEYISTTNSFHQVNVSPTLGEHTLTIVDNIGHQYAVRFEVIGD